MGIKDILMFSFIAAIIVLVVMNGPNAATVLTAGLNGWQGETKILTGSGYNK